MTMLGDELRAAKAILIGGSAGAVEALARLLPALPADAPPVLVVVHIPAHRPSLLASLYAPRCAMRVAEAEDKQPLERGTIHFAPPDYHLMVDEGPAMALSVDPPVLYSRPSIDVLFESAVPVLGRRTHAIALGGASEDGARGLAALAEAGASTWVLDPEEAVAVALPKAAIALDARHRVLGLGAMAAAMARAGGVPA